MSINTIPMQIIFKNKTMAYDINGGGTSIVGTSICVAFLIISKLMEAIMPYISMLATIIAIVAGLTTIALNVVKFFDRKKRMDK
jgi:cytochrome c biogenesis protein CcdA